MSHADPLKSYRKIIVFAMDIYTPESVVFLRLIEPISEADRKAALTVFSLGHMRPTLHDRDRVTLYNGCVS